MPVSIALLLTLDAFAQDPVPTGRLSGVTVYPDRAAVTRTVDVELEPGVNTVEFFDLPPTIDERTIQAEGTGVAGARLLGIDVRTRELAEDRRAKVAALQTDIEALSDALRADNDEIEAAATELRFLDGLQTAAAQQASAELLFAPQTPKHVADIADLLRTRVPEVQARIRRASIAAREKQARIDALNRERATVEGVAQYARRDVEIQIDSPAAGTATVSLTYVLPGASWTAAYDARARPEASVVDLTLNALVTQTSGEDWSAVKLSLSTARPAGGIDPPRLDPFVLAPPVPIYYEPPSGRAYGGEDMDEDMPVEIADKKKEEASPDKAPPPPMAVAVAQVREEAVSATFDVTAPTSVPGDGTRRKVRVSILEVPAGFLHVSAPRVEEAAYLVAEGDWGAPWPLLPGEVSAFVGDSFVGASYTPLVGTGGEFSFGFGRDDAVEITSETITDYTSGGRKVTVDLAWDYTAINHRKNPVKLEIRDRIPQPLLSKYKVRYEGDPPTEQTPEGLVTFAADLAPGQEQKFRFAYRVRYPRNNPPGAVR